MSHFVVEHYYKDYQVIETLCGIEDIDMTQFPKLKTLWVCETMEEVTAVENELRRKHERSSK